MGYAQVCFNEQAEAPRLNNEWLLDARTEQHRAYAGDEKHDGNGGGNLYGLFLIQGSLVRSKLRQFFLLVITEVRMDQSYDAADQQDDAKNEHQALHVAVTYHNGVLAQAENQLDTPLRVISAKEWQS